MTQTTVVTVPLSLCLLVVVLGWNQRIMCDANHLRNNQVLLNWMYGEFFATGSDDDGIREVLAALKGIENRGMDLGVLPYCGNITLHNGSCCHEESFSRLHHAILSVYHSQPLHYPIQQQALNLSSRCNRTFPTLSLYQPLLQSLQEYEEEFINSSICLLCLGRKDIPNYLYPATYYNALIINAGYFHDSIKVVKKIFMQLEELHGKMKKEIQGCRNKQNKQMVTDEALDGWRLCRDEKSCEELVVQYYGNAAAPMYSRFIRAKARGEGISQFPPIYYLGSDFGFMGNKAQTALYPLHTFPNITLYNFSSA